MRYFRNNIIDKGLTSDREALERLHSENGLAVLSGTTSMEYEMFLQKRQETYISKEPFVHGYYSSWMFGKVALLKFLKFSVNSNMKAMFCQ